jgi:tetratricopeptide (TPR) repeat protein
MVLSHHDSARNRDPKKFLRDARVLRREIRKNPKNTRDWFYYAQCLASAGKIDGAIEAYRQRVRLGDGPNPEEVFFSLYQVAALRGWRGESWMDVARAYLEAFQVRPTRAEPLWALASLHREHRELNLAELYARKACSLPKPDGDLLFVDNSVYDWRAADVLAGVLAEMGRLAESRGILERMLQQPSLIGDERGRVRTNLDIVTQKLAA